MSQQDFLTKGKNLSDLKNKVRVSSQQHVLNRCFFLMIIPLQHEKSHSIKNIFISKNPLLIVAFLSWLFTQGICLWLL